MELIGYLLTGAAMGLLSGLLGIGGGVVAVPVMIFCLGMDAKMAMGTSLAVIVPVAISGSFKQYRQKSVDLRAAALLAVSGIFAAYLGAYLNNLLDAPSLERIFAVFLLLVSVKMLTQKSKTPVAPGEDLPGEGELKSGEE